MTAFVINSGSVTDWDTLSGGSVNATLDTYDISNGSTLRINTDSWWCAGHSQAAGSLDTVSFSGVGGKMQIDGTAVRVIPYNTGTGTVPAIGTSITQGGVSGPLLGVWSGWQTDPVAVGGAMPASGYIKVKSVSGGAFASGALSGISATATGPDVVGWIEVLGSASTIAVPRTSTVEVIGDWFLLGTTNGARGQVLPCPTTATIASIFPGVWIETGAGTGIYERYAGAGTVAASAPTDTRAKVVWQTTSGIVIGFNGSNMGFLPPTGCKVRIPNVILTCCSRSASGSGPRVLPPGLITTRKSLNTLSGGAVSINYAVSHWYLNTTQAYSVQIVNVAASDTVVLNNTPSAVNIDNLIVSPVQGGLNAFVLNATSCTGGGTIQNSLFARASLGVAGYYVNQFNFNKGISITNVRSQTLTNRADATTGVWSASQNIECTWTGCTDIGGRMLHSGSQKINVVNHTYSDRFTGAMDNALPHSGIEFTGGCAGVKVDGFALVPQQFSSIGFGPYTALVSSTGCSDIKIRNIATAAAPLDLTGGAIVGAIFNSPGGNIGVKINRCYVAGTRFGPWVLTNTDNGVTIENVKADYADVSVIPAVNAITKAVSLLGATTGQTGTYGTHWKDSFTSATVGKIEILCNEPTSISAAQCSITAGSPKFNSSGSVLLTSVGQQVTWEMPHFALGHTALANLAETLVGTNTGNLTYEFQYNIGSGYNGTWLAFGAANFNSVGAVNPAIGIRLKIRVTCATASAANALTNIAVPTVTTASAQDGNPYPLDEIYVTVAVNVKTLAGANIQNARVLLKAASGGPFPSDATVTITNSGTTATVSHTAHAMAAGDKVVIKGASILANNGVFTITRIDDNSYSYTMGSAPGSNPTGTIKATFVVLSGLTDANGDISISRVFPSAQPVSGWVRYGSSPYYKPAALGGAVSSTLGYSAAALMIDDV